MEIQRKWKIDSINHIPADIMSPYGEKEIRGYLAIEPVSGREVRICQRGDRYFLECKSGHHVQPKVKTEISKQVFDAYWPLTVGYRLEKTLYRLELTSGISATLSVYANKLAGINVIEAKFADLEEAKAFRPPTWFGEEVTRDPRYYNRQLVRSRPYDDIVGDDDLPAGAWSWN